MRRCLRLPLSFVVGRSGRSAVGRPAWSRISGSGMLLCVKRAFMPTDKVFSCVALLAEPAGERTLSGMDAFVARTVLAALEDPGTLSALVDASGSAGLGEAKWMIISAGRCGDEGSFHGCR